MKGLSKKRPTLYLPKAEFIEPPKQSRAKLPDQTPIRRKKYPAEPAVADLAAFADEGFYDVLDQPYNQSTPSSMLDGFAAAIALRIGYQGI
ncbi:MAG: hypothetical protein AVO38_06835 [delta proteobacterium ML8_D]|nr:MAG: hypothetical protein AVO38_06835 [delta proteobacterium ML8_D]